MRIVVISGLSGAGKSVALRLLEDEGYYCIDNLPASLLGQTVDYLEAAGYASLALGIDARSHASLADAQTALSGLRVRPAVELRVLFLEATDACLVRRFSETRRRHPLSHGEWALADCLREERELLTGLAAEAHRIDTSEVTANTLREWIKQVLSLEHGAFTVVFESFGFKHGLPLDADLVFDVRCLPNPHYDPLLRELTGKDDAVATFLGDQPAVQDMLGDIRIYLEKWLPVYRQDNRAYFTVALGCTGGQHRSVYFVERLAAHFALSSRVLTRHRELT